MAPRCPDRPFAGIHNDVPRGTDECTRIGVRRDLATRQLSTTLAHCDGHRQRGMLVSELVTGVARNEGFVA